jgi:hypothetical protein
VFSIIARSVTGKRPNIDDSTQKEGFKAVTEGAMWKARKSLGH